MSSNYTWNAPHPIYGIPLAVTQSDIQPTLTCTIRLSPSLSPPPTTPTTTTTTTTVKTWLNTNYFLWTLSAAHATTLSATNPSNPWSQTFNFAVWTEIQNRVAEIENPYRFGIPIPEPPVTRAVVTHFPDTDAEELVRFVIRKEEGRMGVVSGLAPGSVWGLLRFVSNRVCGRFEVVLFGEEQEDEEDEGEGEEEGFVFVGDEDVGEEVGSVEGDVWKAEIWEYLDQHDEFEDLYDEVYADAVEFQF
ncbi:uncharacterized protein N7515_000896 [Penicillium bovifimosum]|uniref:Uncharacterized protein n=1 Tax=Penicillium bovifimosum TaxID=126998 RepID=A0A9W9HG88_9EURO|nr:uncharacterized protein N7515_000896 [Penicillium bovifimosum]KAJ5146332.1 hypothetical protein N7515_000896 [Penicillium bovifimosum]